MSLEACPVCGYAVSTVTFTCRHCAQNSRIKWLGSAQPWQLIAPLIIVSYVIFLWFHH
jgi:hypothetical protein